jgi:hypothetical protein
VDKVIFSPEEIVIFSLMTLEIQLREKLIDLDHMPNKRLTNDAHAEVDALKLKIDETKTIPHPVDVAKATEALYEDRADFVAMFETMVKRSTEDGTLPAGSIH